MKLLKIKGWNIEFGATAWYQIELLPRFTIGNLDSFWIVAFEFLFWSLYAQKFHETEIP